MLTCSDATQKMSEGLDHRLSWPARMSLRLHVLMCGACRRYGRQIRGVERLLKEYDSWKGAEDLRLSKGRREKIKRSLRS